MDYSQRDSSDFRLYWQYMPRFRVLDKADFVRTTAVFLMLFVFIAVLCLSAVIVIACTRCMTIAQSSRQVYSDLRRLGAPGHCVPTPPAARCAGCFDPHACGLWPDLRLLRPDPLFQRRAGSPPGSWPGWRSASGWPPGWGAALGGVPAHPGPGLRRAGHPAAVTTFYLPI